MTIITTYFEQSLMHILPNHEILVRRTNKRHNIRRKPSKRSFFFHNNLRIKWMSFGKVDSGGFIYSEINSWSEPNWAKQPAEFNNFVYNEFRGLQTTMKWCASLVVVKNVKGIVLVLNFWGKLFRGWDFKKGILLLTLTAHEHIKGRKQQAKGIHLKNLKSVFTHTRLKRFFRKMAALFDYKTTG
jgi:hypothetical protein